MTDRPDPTRHPAAGRKRRPPLPAQPAPDPIGCADDVDDDEADDADE